MQMLDKATHSGERNVAQGHLRAVKVEKVHKLDSAPFTKSSEVDALRLVIEFELNRKDLDVLWEGRPSARADLVCMTNADLRKKGVVLGEGALLGFLVVEKLKNRLKKSRASWSTCSRKGKILAYPASASSRICTAWLTFSRLSSPTPPDD